MCIAIGVKNTIIMKTKLLLIFFYIAISSAIIAQTSKTLIGDWVANVNEFGTSKTIYFTMYADFTSEYSFVIGDGISFGAGGWAYENGILYESWSYGRKGKGRITWVDRDHFIITIINNGDPAYQGLKRHYFRRKYS